MNMSYYDWSKILENNSDNELAKIIRDNNSEPKEKVEAALNELKKRGIDTENYTQMLESIKNNEPKPNENSPILYSDRVIFTFSILFSVVFGGFLFARNLKEINNRKGIFPALAFSFIYMAFSIYVLDLIKAGTGGTFILSAIGGLILNKIFWNKYIGETLVYRKKSYRKPLIIALIIFVPITVLAVLSLIINGPV